MVKIKKVPIGWELTPLSKVLVERTERKGKTEVEIYSVAVNKGVVNQVEHLGRSYAAEDTSNYNLVSFGDIVYTKSPTGDFPYGIVKQSHVKQDVAVSPLYGVYKPGNFYLGLFLDFYFQSHINANNYLKKIVNKGAKNTILVSNQGFLHNRILLPNDVTEQQKIVEILMMQDKIIALKEKLLGAKKEQKQWLMQNLLTGKIRLNGFKEAWKKQKLGNYLIEYNEKSTRNNQFPVLTSSRRGLFLQSDYYNREVASEDNTGYNVVPYGYFTYRHMSDDNVFVFNINTIVPKGIVSTLYPVFTTKDINDVFLAAILNYGEEFSRFVRTQKQGGSRTYIFFSKLNNLILTIPQFEEQSAIAERLIVADKEIELLAKDLESQKSLKKYLMQQLLTGKIRV